jgi:hypothetical protein
MNSNGDLGVSIEGTGYSTVWAGSIASTFRGTSPSTFTTLIGSVGAHELLHSIASIDDLPFKASQPNDIMSANNNPDAYSKYLNNKFTVTPAEKAALLAICQKRENAGVAPPSSLQVLVADEFELGLEEVESEEPNTSVTTSQSINLPAPCNNPNYPCTVDPNPITDGGGGTPSITSGNDGSDPSGGNTNQGNDDDDSMMIAPKSSLDALAVPIFFGLVILPFASSGLRKRKRSRNDSSDEGSVS